MQLFKDSECCSGRGLNPRSPAQWISPLPTELTRQRSSSHRAGPNSSKQNYQQIVQVHHTSKEQNKALH